MTIPPPFYYSSSFNKDEKFGNQGHVRSTTQLSMKTKGLETKGMCEALPDFNEEEY